MYKAIYMGPRVTPFITIFFQGAPVPLAHAAGQLPITLEQLRSELLCCHSATATLFPEKMLRQRMIWSLGIFVWILFLGKCKCTHA